MYKTILVAIDLEQPSSWQTAFPTALAIAKCFGVRIGLAYVVPDRVRCTRAEWSSLAVRRILDSARARLGTLSDQLAGGLDVDVRVATGRVHAGVIEITERSGTDLSGAHRPQMRDALLGENTERVVRHAARSVLVARG